MLQDHDLVAWVKATADWIEWWLHSQLLVHPLFWFSWHPSCLQIKFVQGGIDRPQVFQDGTWLTVHGSAWMVMVHGLWRYLMVRNDSFQLNRFNPYNRKLRHDDNRYETSGLLPNFSWKFRAKRVLFDATFKHLRNFSSKISNFS